MRLRALALVLAAIGVATLIAAPAASAKEDVKATLISEIPLDAPAGAELDIAWKLFYVDENGERRPFGANGVFVRLLSASGAASQEGVAHVGADDTGAYEATVVVPQGGIRDIEIRLMGWMSYATGNRRSDRVFPITNDPVPTPGPIASAGADGAVPAASERGAPTWLFVLAASLLSLLALVVAAVVLRRRRYRTTALAVDDPQPLLSPKTSSKP